MNDTLFVQCLLMDKIILRPANLANTFTEALMQRVRAKVEGKCTHHGYVKRGSVRFYKVSPGEIMAHTLNGNIQYTVQYYADVCNPAVQAILKGNIVSLNRFGVLVSVSHPNENPGGKPIVVIEAILARDRIPPEIRDTLRVGEEVAFRVLGKKYALNDQKISVVGQIEIDTVTQAYKKLIDSFDRLDGEASDQEIPPEEEEEEEEEAEDEEEKEEPEEGEGEDTEDDKESEEDDEEDIEDEPLDDPSDSDVSDASSEAA